MAAATCGQENPEGTSRTRMWASRCLLCFLVTCGALLLGAEALLPKTGRLAPHLSFGDETECWATEGPYESDCYHAEPLRSRKHPEYPLSEEMFDRSIPYVTTDVQLHRAFERARSRGLLKIVALGGSVTYGHGCVSPSGLNHKGCAWPHRLQQWFDERVEDFQVEVINSATPASDIKDLLHNDIRGVLPLDSDIDLILVDFGINDAVLDHFDFDLENVKRAHEVFIRYVKIDMVNSPAMLYAENYIHPLRVLRAPEQGDNMARVHADVARKHDIPMASFRDAVWPDINDSDFAQSVWGEAIHPAWNVQQLLADVVVFYIQKSYARFLEVHGTLTEPSPHEEAIDTFVDSIGCFAADAPYLLDTSKYVGKDPPQELVQMAGWSFSKDTHGDAGLIGFGNSSTLAAVSFDLPCSGEKRVLEVKYLKSYQDMGAVKAVVEHENSTVIMDGLWGSMSSLKGYHAFALPEGLDTIRVTFVMLSEQTEKSYESFLYNTTKIVRADRKFKLLDMQCC